ncbi:MAG: HIT family protein [Microthrixaceae bacterium]
MSQAPSVFSQIDSSEWIASNKFGFAIFDNYPVTQGHVLIISHREIPTWFDATASEQAGLLELTQQVKLLLDAQFSPDGYNLGINAGAAAGQTISHLHIHLIPRRTGDVADPRGGVRYVIPERGNYLT